MHVVVFSAHPDNPGYTPPLKTLNSITFVPSEVILTAPGIGNGHILSLWGPPIIPLQVICTKTRKTKLPAAPALA